MLEQSRRTTGAPAPLRVVKVPIRWRSKGVESVTLTFSGDPKFEPGFSMRDEGSDGRKGKVTSMVVES